MRFAFVIIIVAAIWYFIVRPFVRCKKGDCNLTVGGVYPGSGCKSQAGYDTGDMCHQLAVKSCQTAAPLREGCWLNTYSKCMETGSMMHCTKIADESCQPDNTVSEGCYSSFYQKCQNGM